MHFNVMLLNACIISSVKNVIYLLPMLFDMYDGDGCPWCIKSNQIIHMLDVLYLDVVYAMYALFVVYRAYAVYAAYVCLHVIMYAWLDVCGNDFIEWFHLSLLVLLPRYAKM